MPSPTAIPRPPIRASHGPTQVVEADEVEAFRRALRGVAAPDVQPESHSDFAALSETQHGRLL